MSIGEDPLHRVMSLVARQTLVYPRPEMPEVRGEIMNRAVKRHSRCGRQPPRFIVHAVRAGKTVVSVPVQGSAGRDTLHVILERHGARLITHFGEWVTEMME